MQRGLSGTFPNVDPSTGEPQFGGETQKLLEQMRSAANVSTFDEAVSHCRFGPYSRKVTIMNAKDGQTSTWVSDDRTKATYWVPAGELESISATRKGG